MSDHVWTRLQDRRETVLRLLRSLERDFTTLVESARDSNSDDEHDPDGTTIAFERAQVEALIASTRRTLDGLDAAIDRLANRTYGVCERCGRQIAAERLEVRPASATCVRCAT